MSPCSDWWCSETSRRWPDACIHGMETYNFHNPSPPNNVEIHHLDVNRGIPWPDQTFHHIHIRGQLGLIKVWQDVLREGFRTLRPGGVFEYCDMYVNPPSPSQPMQDSASAWVKCSHIMDKVQRKTSQPFRFSLDMCSASMRAAGFEIYLEHQRTVSLAGTDRFTTTLLYVIIQKLLGIVAYYLDATAYTPSIAAERAERGRAWIRQLPDQLTKQCGNVSVQL